MSKPTEHKTVQARILAYAEAIGWTMVSREEAERRRGFDPEVPPAARARNRSLFFDDLLDAQLRTFNPRDAEAEGALFGRFRHLPTDIYGNRVFWTIQRLAAEIRVSGAKATMRHYASCAPLFCASILIESMVFRCGAMSMNAPLSAL